MGGREHKNNHMLLVPDLSSLRILCEQQTAVEAKRKYRDDGVPPVNADPLYQAIALNERSALKINLGIADDDDRVRVFAYFCKRLVFSHHIKPPELSSTMRETLFKWIDNAKGMRADTSKFTKVHLRQLDSVVAMRILTDADGELITRTLESRNYNKIFYRTDEMEEGATQLPPTYRMVELASFQDTSAWSELEVRASTNVTTLLSIDAYADVAKTLRDNFRGYLRSYLRDRQPTQDHKALGVQTRFVVIGSLLPQLVAVFTARNLLLRSMLEIYEHVGKNTTRNRHDELKLYEPIKDPKLKQLLIKQLDIVNAGRASSHMTLPDADDAFWDALHRMPDTDTDTDDEGNETLNDRLKRLGQTL